MDPIVPQKSLMEQTVGRIRGAIIRGELPLGSKVSEQRLADMLHISRSPVREALALLQIEGLIRVLPKRGSFVFTPDDKAVDDLCDHRAVLETACLDFAIARNPERLVDGLRQALAQMQRAEERNDPAGYAEGDISFHRTIIEASDNDSISRIYDATLGPLMALRTHLFTAMNAHRQRSSAEHVALLDACRRKDTKRAQDLVREHIFHLAQHYRAAGAEEKDAGT